MIDSELFYGVLSFALISLLALALAAFVADAEPW